MTLLLPRPYRDIRSGESPVHYVSDIIYETFCKVNLNESWKFEIQVGMKHGNFD